MQHIRKDGLPTMGISLPLMRKCGQVGEDPLMCVSSESDGRKPWMTDADGRSRVGTAAEAAEWVAYCSQPDNEYRKNPARTWEQLMELYRVHEEKISLLREQVAGMGAGGAARCGRPNHQGRDTPRDCRRTGT